MSEARSGDGARPRWLRGLALLAAVLSMTNALWAAWDQGLTYDEPDHLAWPRRLLFERVDERASRWLFDSKTPALLPSVLAVAALERAGAHEPRLLRLASRVTPLAFLAGLLALTLRIGARLAPDGGWLALLLVALDPNLAAHASVATTDVGYALAVLAFAASLLRHQGRPRDDLLTGAALGLGFVMKLTAALLVPFALLPLIWHRPAGLAHAARRLAVLAASFCGVVDAAYLLVGVGSPLGSLRFETPLFQGLGAWAPWLPLPLPRSLLTGLDLSRAHDSGHLWHAYVFGSVHPGGTWYYFAAHWLIKTPVALLAFTVLGLARAGRCLAAGRAGRLFLALFATHLAFFSFAFGTQIGYRFALACVPLAALLAAGGLSGLSARAVALLTLMALVERAPYAGDPIAFTNLAVLPKATAYRFTNDSNLDWGQDNERLPRYLAARGLPASAQGRAFGPGLFVTRANDLALPPSDAHRWLALRRPRAIALGYAHLAFDVTPAMFETYLDEMRRVPALSSEGCGGPPAVLAPGRSLPVGAPPPDGAPALACARSQEGGDVVFVARLPAVGAGWLDAAGRCVEAPAPVGHEVWFRLDPGLAGVICLRSPDTRGQRPVLGDLWGRRGEAVVRLARP